MAKLTHDDLVKLGLLLGYPLSPKGLCAGFSGMLMQAILAQEEEQFWQRLKLIEYYKTDFTSLIRVMEEVKLKAKTKKLDEQDIEFLELLAFYEGIELYLQPHNHQDVFDKRPVSQSYLNDIYALTHSRKQEHTNLRILLNKAYAFSHSRLINYLNDLETVLIDYPNLPILIENSYHRILLKYNKNHAKKNWMFVDTNDFEAYPKLSSYYRELT
ncbi:hypothetical protein [uncultured Legionella sp.]|uniref:hypothetical protein n=1 Tax=uncultured Legionella sp. TaxID=210934 RepID=UPI00261AE15A|nr:hypothetical protein [uncultured Legionella sp.]